MLRLLLLQAISMIHAESDPWARWPAKPPLLVRTRDLPPAVTNAKALSGFLDLDEPPGCATYELPSYGSPQVYVQDDDGDGDDGDGGNGKQGRDGGGRSDWEYEQSGVSTLVPRAELSLPGCAHSDACAGYAIAPHARPAKTQPDKSTRRDLPRQPGAASKAPPPMPPPPLFDARRAAIATAEAEKAYIRPLAFMLPRMQRGFIAVCCDAANHAPKMRNKDDCAKRMIYGGARFTFDGGVLEPLPRDERHGLEPHGMAKCVNLQEKFSTPVHSAEGHLMITVALPRNLHDVRITHVIAF